MRNAAYLCFIEGLGKWVAELAEEIQENLDREDSHPINIPLGRVGTNQFELHAVMISYFEWLITADRVPH